MTNGVRSIGPKDKTENAYKGNGNAHTATDPFSSHRCTAHQSPRQFAVCTGKIFFSNISLVRLIRSLNFCAAESALAARTLLLTARFCKLSRSQNASSCTGSED